MARAVQLGSPGSARSASTLLPTRRSCHLRPWRASVTSTSQAAKVLGGHAIVGLQLGPIAAASGSGAVMACGTTKPKRAQCVVVLFF